MKKLLVVLLALFIAGGAFAQDVSIAATGVFDSSFGLHSNFGANDVNANAWHFGFGDAKLGATVSGGPVSAMIRLQGASGYTIPTIVNIGFAALDAADVTVALKSVDLSAGYGWLPWTFWGSVNLFGDNNYNCGASGIKDTYFQVKFAASDALNFYAGLAGRGVDGETLKDNAVFPGFYLGGDFGQDKFSAGAAFMGTPRGKNWDGNNDSRFFWTFDLHGKVKLDPVTIGLNLAFYGDPAAGRVMDGRLATPIAAVDWSDFSIFSGTKDDLIFEGMLDFGFGFDSGNLGVSLGMVSNMAPKDKGGQGAGLKIGAGYDFDLGGGFLLTPGAFLLAPVSGAGGADPDKASLDVAVTFTYSF